MKYIFTLLSACLLLFSCGNDKGNSNKTNSKTANGLKLPKKSSDEIMILKILGSDFAGTYELKNNDIMSQMNVGYDKNNNAISISVSGIQPTNSKQPKITLLKWAEGKTEKGVHKGFGKCLMFQIIDLSTEKTYRRVDGEAKDCGNVRITEVGKWKDKGHIKRERGIIGNYRDNVTLVVTNDDDTTKQQEATFEVQFALLQQEIKTN